MKFIAFLFAALLCGSSVAVAFESKLPSVDLEKLELDEINGYESSEGTFYDDKRGQVSYCDVFIVCPGENFATICQARGTYTQCTKGRHWIRCYATANGRESETCLQCS